MGKAERGSAEVFQLVLDHAHIFLFCSKKDAESLWSATSIIRSLRSMSRTMALKTIPHLLHDIRLNASLSEGEMSDVQVLQSPGDLSLRLEDTEEELPRSAPELGHSSRISQQSTAASSSSQPGRPSRQLQHEVQQHRLDSALRGGRNLSGQVRQKTQEIIYWGCRS